MLASATSSSASKLHPPTACTPPSPQPTLARTALIYDGLHDRVEDGTISATPRSKAHIPQMLMITAPPPAHTQLLNLKTAPAPSGPSVSRPRFDTLPLFSPPAPVPPPRHLQLQAPRRRLAAALPPPLPPDPPPPLTPSPPLPRFEATTTSFTVDRTPPGHKPSSHPPPALATHTTPTSTAIRQPPHLSLTPHPFFTRRPLVSLIFAPYPHTHPEKRPARRRHLLCCCCC